MEDAGGRAPPAREVQADDVRELPIELIVRNPEQPRRAFDDAALEELADSIRENGVLQPILVRPVAESDTYQIVAGERRWRASQRAGLTRMPVLVRELDDRQAMEIAVIENVQRSDLNPIEEAQGYRALIDRFGRTQESVAQAVGKSRSHVANALRLLALPAEVRDHLAAERLSAGHARAIASAPDPVALARSIVDRGLNVRQAEALARSAQNAPETKSASRTRPAPTPGSDADTRALEQDLEDLLGLKVTIEDRGGVGQVRVEYGTLEQLDDICQRLSRSG
jgi:ParB family chromosome partitioning protein